MTTDPALPAEAASAAPPAAEVPVAEAPAADPGDPAFVDALAQLSFLVQRTLAEVGAEHELSVVQIRLLGVLRDRRPGMLELGTHLGLDKSSMTGLVSRAEKRGLVQRSPSPHDGRAVLVALTPLGRALTERCGAEIARRVAALAGHLTAEERTLITHLAAALVRPSTRLAPLPLEG